MGRWYQNVLTGEQVEVHTFEEEDRYLDTPPWSRIPAPPDASPLSEAASRLAAEKANNEEASEAGRALQASKRSTSTKPARKKA